MDCTVVIPAFNAEDYIADAVASAAAQFPDHADRVIVVDDGSTDATALRASESGKAQVIRQDNAGVSAARNRGLAAVETEFVVFLDADDTLEPGALTAHGAALAKHPEAVIAVGANYRMNADGTRVSAGRQDNFVTDDPARVAMEITPCSSQVMFRTDALRAEGGYCEGLAGAEDVDLFLRLLSQGAILCHSAYVMNYRLHGGQTTKNSARLCRDHLVVLRRRLGPDGHALAKSTLRRISRKWKTYYGQFMPIEAGRLLLRGRVTAAGRSLLTFFACLPQSAYGSAGFLRTRLSTSRKEAS